MRRALGIDTSNYTTSVAYYDCIAHQIRQERMLLPVKEGALGLRQSDAVFHHVQQLPMVMDRLTAGGAVCPEVIGVSVRPRPVEGSYMPCFESGRSQAEVLGSVLGVPVRTFSHQEGHIAAALWSADCIDELTDRFVAFHLSGGTTEAVLVRRKPEGGMDIEMIAGSLDLKAGQAIDRVAGMLGLGFPGGAALDRLAQQCDEPIRCKPTLKGLNCCLSGLENRCSKLIEEGREPAYVARFCFEYIAKTLLGMCEGIRAEYGELPLLFAGGVSSNSIIRRELTEGFGVRFAAPEFSCDNAAGIALLAAGVL
ncbi:MAG: peptidase M22 [Ruminococcaceae bacterium]|nr:peptidase M22 [Oscillospiraceae bacterium]